MRNNLMEYNNWFDRVYNNNQGNATMQQLLQGENQRGGRNPSQ